jgi:hypothetical protein
MKRQTGWLKVLRFIEKAKRCLPRRCLPSRNKLYDWRNRLAQIVDYLENPPRKVSRKLRYKAIKFVLLDGSLFYKSLDGVLLQCLGQEEAKKMMSEVHDGLC